MARGVVAIAIAIVLGIVGASIGGLFAAGALGGSNTTDTPAPTLTSVSITPDALARLVSPDGVVAIDLEAQTVNSPSQLSYSPLSPDDIPALPANFTVTGKAFELTTKATSLKPITISVSLSAADATLAAGREDNIVLQHHRDGVGRG